MAPPVAALHFAPNLVSVSAKGMAALHPHRRPSTRLPGDAGGERRPSQRGRLQREQLPAPALRALASAQLPVPRPFSGPFGQARPRAAIDRAAGVRHARRDLPARVLRSRKSFRGTLRRWGHGRPPDNVNAQGGLISGKLAGWRVGDARVLTRSRGFAVADLGGRLHLLASAIEVHVAARRLRRIVPLGIRPNGTIPFRRGRPSSGSTRPSRSLPGVLLCAKR